MQDTGLHYDHYLREVIDFLEKDEHFREKLRNTDMDDIKVIIVLFIFFYTNLNTFLQLLLTLNNKKVIVFFVSNIMKSAFCASHLF